jgi:uncharacterized membrane protein
MLKRFVTKDAMFFVVAIIACGILFFIPAGHENKSEDQLCKACVTSVDNHNVLSIGVINHGTQSLNLEILSGPFAGRIVQTDNILIGDMQIDFVFEAGDKVLARVFQQQQDIQWVEVIGPDRLNIEIILTCLFVVLLIAVAGSTGARAILSFVFSVLIIWKVFIPCCLAKYDPILCGLAVVSAITFVISVLVGGWCKKGIIAFMGSFSGILVTCLMAVLFSKYFFLNGSTRPFAKTVLMKVSTDIDITRIFIAGVFIACSGAVMDLAMDISAALCEIKVHHPRITFKELLGSGLKIGRSVIGTMTTTLLLAYSGGYTALLMYFMAQGLDIAVMLNTSFLSAEILNTLVGSFGLVTVAPLTALIGSAVLSYSKPGISNASD